MGHGLGVAPTPRTLGYRLVVQTQLKSPFRQIYSTTKLTSRVSSPSMGAESEIGQSSTRSREYHNVRMWPADNPGRIGGQGERRNAIIGSSSCRFFLTIREISMPLAPLTIGHFCPMACSADGAKNGQAGSLHCRTSSRSKAARVTFPSRDTPRKGRPCHEAGDRVTTLPSREIAPKTARKIRKSLGLD